MIAQSEINFKSSFKICRELRGRSNKAKIRVETKALETEGAMGRRTVINRVTKETWGWGW